MRNAIYRELIAADNQLDYLEHGRGQWVEAVSEDYNFDLCPGPLGQRAIDRLRGPRTGGIIMSLMLCRSAIICGHIAASTGGLSSQSPSRQRTAGGAAASIHDRVVFKQQGLDKRLQYDKFPAQELLRALFR